MTKETFIKIPNEHIFKYGQTASYVLSYLMGWIKTNENKKNKKYYKTDDKYQTCLPVIKIATDLGLSVDVVKASLKSLEDSEAIEISRNKGNPSGYSTGKNIINPISKAFIKVFHSIVKKLGTFEACLIDIVHQWCELAKKTSKNFHDGFYWAKLPLKKIMEILGQKQVVGEKPNDTALCRKVKRHMMQLCNGGLLVKSFSNSYDRTASYRVNHEHPLLSQIYKPVTKDVSSFDQKSSTMNTYSNSLGQKPLTNLVENVPIVGGKMSQCSNNNIRDNNNPVVPLADELRKQKNAVTNPKAAHKVSMKSKNTVAEKPAKDVLGVENERITNMFESIMKTYGMHVSWLSSQIESFRGKYARKALTLRRWERLVKTWGDNLFEEFKSPDPSQTYHPDKSDHDQIVKWGNANKDKFPDYFKEVDAWGGIETCLKTGFPPFNGV